MVSTLPVSRNLHPQLMFSAFKTLTGQTVTVELKNDLAIQGTLKSVDQFLNFKLDDIRVLNEARYPHMVRTHRIRRSLTRQLAVKSTFIRGSVVRYVHIPPAAVDTQLLEDATRRGTLASRVAAPTHMCRGRDPVSAVNDRSNTLYT